MTLLIIDDEPDILDLVANQIQASGFVLEVTTAQNVAVAEKLLPKCDLVLSDINMPNKETLEKILAASGKPVARITGYIEISGEWILHKPFQVDEFDKMIRKLMSEVK